MRALIAFLGLPLAAAPVATNYLAEVRLQSRGVYAVKVSVKVSGDWPEPVFTVGRGMLQRVTPVDGVVSYQVTATDKRKYIPLAVPEIAGSGAPQSVEIAVFSDEKLAGDMFPMLSADGDGRWVARMANIVNHVEFETGPGAWGPRQWSDLAAVLMVAGGLMLRKVLI
jgi:hypothetical protein